MKIQSVLTFYQPNTLARAAMWDNGLCPGKWAVRLMVGWRRCAEFRSFSRQQSRRLGIGKSSPRICACWFNVSCCQSDPAAVPISQTYRRTPTNKGTEASPHGFWLTIASIRPTGNMDAGSIKQLFQSLKKCSLPLLLNLCGFILKNWESVTTVDAASTGRLWLQKKNRCEKSLKQNLPTTAGTSSYSPPARGEAVSEASA